MVFNSINFWDYNAWSIIIQIGIILFAVMVSNILRWKINKVKKSLLPTSVIAGSLIFIIKFIPKVGDFVDTSLMEILTYHCLGLGFIALSLKTITKSRDFSKRIVLFSGLITVNGYLIQAIIGLGLSILLSLFIFKDLFYAAGLLLPMGFGQGTGQALNFGNIFETLGFNGGASFGLAIAAIGFFVACICGVIYLNILKGGKLKIQLERKETANELNSDIYTKDESPLNDGVDKLTIQLAFIMCVYLFTFIFIYVASYISENYLGDFGKNTLKPLFWGFNFIIGSLLAILIKKIVLLLRKKNLMKRDYINNYMMTRLSGFFFDLMIVAGIAAIDWSNLDGMWIPLIIICTFGGIFTFFYIKFICKKIYPTYEYEAFFSIFGMLTGTASTGMILLREIDPNYETPAAENLVLQQLPAIIFGAPLLLLISFSGQSLINSYITLGIVCAMFLVYNLVLLWKFLFKRKTLIE